MAVIAAPDFRVKSIDWSLDRPAQINSSLLTGKRTVTTAPWYGKWRASVELAPAVGEDGYRLLRSFLVRCQGPVHRFKLYAVAEPQNANSGVTVASTAASGATTMSLSGAATALTEGQMVTVNDQLVVLTADQAGAAITFEPPLRVQASAGTSVETARPWAMVRLTAAQSAWGVDPGQLFAADFDVEEAI